MQLLKEKDSQGICFVGKVDLPTFLQQKLEPKKGNIIEIRDLNLYHSISDISGFESITDNNLAKITRPFNYVPSSGVVIGTHNGAHFYTIGQRKGMNIGGYKEPLFVIATDVEKNIVYVGEGHSHPGLNRKGLFVRHDEIHWIRTDFKMKIGENREYLVRIRYRQELQKAKLFMAENGLYIVFDNLQRGIAPGQFATWYENDEVIGSGVINS